MASEGVPSHVNPYLTTFADTQGGVATKQKSHDVTPQTNPKNGYTEKIKNFHPKGPKPQNHVSEAIVGYVDDIWR